MKYSNKTRIHDKVVVAMNANKEKYLSYKSSTNGDLIGMYACFGVPRKFKYCRGGFARVTSPEKLVLKENANIKLIVDNEGQLLARGKTLSVDISFPYPTTFTFQ